MTSLGNALPKSRRSKRKIELSRPAVEALRRHRQQVREAALAAGRPFDRNGYVFSRVDGQALAVTSTWKLWGRLLKKAEVPYVRFHDARHTAATLLLSKGVHPKVVSEMLGHSTVAITLDVYSHVTASMHKEAAKVMDGIFGWLVARHLQSRRDGRRRGGFSFVSESRCDRASRSLA